MGYKNLSTSRGDGNGVFQRTYSCGSCSCIRTYLPREGTETDWQLKEIDHHARIRTYLPREGPETNQSLA